jgi:hypothetical protein
MGVYWSVCVFWFCRYILVCACFPFSPVVFLPAQLPSHCTPAPLPRLVLVLGFVLDYLGFPCLFSFPLLLLLYRAWICWGWQVFRFAREYGGRGEGPNRGGRSVYSLFLGVHWRGGEMAGKTTAHHELEVD